MTRPPRFRGLADTTPHTVDDLLTGARSGLVRLNPAGALPAMPSGMILTGTRPQWQHRTGGEVPGANIIERSHLEWRCDPSSPARRPHAGHQASWIVCGDEGYSSSLAAASLQALGPAQGDRAGRRLQARCAAGLPVTRPARPATPWPALWLSEWETS